MFFEVVPKCLTDLTNISTGPSFLGGGGGGAQGYI